MLRIGGVTFTEFLPYLYSLWSSNYELVSLVRYYIPLGTFLYWNRRLPHHDRQHPAYNEKTNQGGTSTSSRLDAWKVCFKCVVIALLGCDQLVKISRPTVGSLSPILAHFTESIAKLPWFFGGFWCFFPVALRKESCKLFEKSHVDVSADIVYVI